MIEQEIALAEVWGAWRFVHHDDMVDDVVD